MKLKVIWISCITCACVDFINSTTNVVSVPKVRFHPGPELVGLDLAPGHVPAGDPGMWVFKT